LVLGGLLLGFVPGLPTVTLDPDLVFLLFLPPLLYEAAWTISWRDFRANLRPISLLAIGLVFMTTVVIAIVAHTAIPGLPWAAAFVLGAIVSPTDSVAATSIAQRLGVPHRIVTIVEGESLFNDASGLVAYQFAVAAVVYGTFSLALASLQFVLVSVGGIAVGLAAGWCILQIHRRMNNTPLEIIMTLVAPFAIYLIADAIHVSSVLAVVSAGLYLTRRSHILFSAQTREQTIAVWETLAFLFNGLVFILIGLQLRGVLNALDESKVAAYHSLPNLLLYAAIIGVATILVRFVWVFPASYLPRFFSRRLRERDAYPSWRNVTVIAWTGMRGVVSLAAALAVPTTLQSGASFASRPLIIYLTFCVILATLVIQGLTLPFLIRGLQLKDDGESKREEAKARQTAADAALARIDELMEQQDEATKQAAEHLRTHYEARAKSTAAIADGTTSDRIVSKHNAYLNLQRETLKAEQDAVVDLRNRGEINDDVLRRIERELDLEEERLGG
jgi:CPA1 family monovalent cation:H+ antiporter